MSAFQKATRKKFFDRVRQKNAPLFDRLINRVNVGEPQECWEMKHVARDGYGTVKVAGRNIKAHRLMFSLCFFDPAHFSVMHICDNPACINPLHLKAGTHKENMEDRSKKGRNADHRGNNNGRSKIPASAIEDIRASSLSLSTLAAQYGVTKTAILAIKKGRNWGHLGGHTNG